MKGNYFPKKQAFSMVYSSPAVFEHRIAKNLYLQVSSKDSIFFRVLKLKLIVKAKQLFSTKIDTPHQNAEFVGIVKTHNQVLFELEQDTIRWVWKKSSTSAWQKESFLGYPLIEAYKLTEFKGKLPLIERALKLHWQLVQQSTDAVHGDFTHFNILHNNTGELFFIDRKQNHHSKLFDFYYFYAYLRQCLSHCQTLSTSNEMAIVNMLEQAIKKVCQYTSRTELASDLSDMNVPVISGLRQAEAYKEDFTNIFA